MGIANDNCDNGTWLQWKYGYDDDDDNNDVDSYSNSDNYEIIALIASNNANNKL